MVHPNEFCAVADSAKYPEVAEVSRRRVDLVRTVPLAIASVALGAVLYIQFAAPVGFGGLGMNDGREDRQHEAREQTGATHEWIVLEEPRNRN